MAAVVWINPLHAGTKVKVQGELESVSLQVNQAFDDLALGDRQFNRWEDQISSQGIDKNGNRILVSVRQSGKDECELTIESEAARDDSEQNIEQRFLQLMRSR